MQIVKIIQEWSNQISAPRAPDSKASTPSPPSGVWPPARICTSACFSVSACALTTMNACIQDRFSLSASNSDYCYMQLIHVTYFWGLRKGLFKWYSKREILRSKFVVQNAHKTRLCQRNSTWTWNFKCELSVLLFIFFWGTSIIYIHLSIFKPLSIVCLSPQIVVLRTRKKRTIACV